MRSEELKNLEDEGMSILMVLLDMVESWLTVTDPVQGMVADERADILEDENIHGGALIHAPVKSATDSRDVVLPVTSASVAARPTTPPGHSVEGSRVSTPSCVPNRLVRMTDVASLLPRREFKIYGGQLSDSGSEISYNSICRQIDAGIEKGFSESEVIRTVMKVTKPGNFREMLTNKDDLTVNELKRFLKSHIREKSCTELFHELSNAKQQEKETPQQFMYRIIGLKQHVLSTSQQSDTEFSYDKRLVQGIFLHTLS